MSDEAKVTTDRLAALERARDDARAKVWRAFYFGEDQAEALDRLRYAEQKCALERAAQIAGRAHGGDIADAIRALVPEGTA